MVKRSREDPGRIFLFRPLRKYDLICIVSRPESGCGNQLFLLYPPSVRANSRKLLLAWHAATVFVFLRCGLEQVQVAVPESETSESEALLMMGYRLVETTTEGLETTYLYLCKREEFTPVV